MSLTKPIPPKLREEMANDKFYEKCCITGLSKNAVKIEWHHNLMFGGQRVNAKFCILPLADFVHDKITKYKEKCDWIMWNRASEQEIEKFSKAIDYKRVRDNLNAKYGIYKQ
jgi:hypothetical protein